MEKVRQRHLKFLEDIKAKSGLSLSALAKKAQLSDSTLTRFVSKEQYNRLSTSSLDKLSQVIGYKSYEDYLFNNVYNNKENDNPYYRIDDAKKFEIYESVKRLLAKRQKIVDPKLATELSQEVLEHAKRLNTSYINDSLIMYVIERNFNEKQSEN